MAFSIFDVKELKQDSQLLEDTYTPLTVLVADQWPGKAVCIESCVIRSTDTVDQLVNLHAIGPAASDLGIIASVLVPAGSGSTSVLPFSVPDYFSQSPSNLLLAEEGNTFGWSMPVAPSSGTTVGIQTVLGLF